MATHTHLLPLLLLLAPIAAIGQQSLAIHADPIHLDVVVTDKSGTPVGHLLPSDFTLFDNNVPQSLTAVRELNSTRAAVTVILVLDGVNMDYATFASIRYKLHDFLLANNARLSIMTALTSFTDTGAKTDFQLTADGRELSDQLDHAPIGLRPIPNNDGLQAAVERINLSVRGLRQIIDRLSNVPFRKTIICISPGWPLLEGPEVIIGMKQQQQIFNDVSSLLTTMRLSGTTLYSVNPLGAAAGSDYRYHDFLGGLASPDQAQIGNLSLQVLATQSGGLALNSGNDLVGMIKQSIADTQDFYEITYTPTASDRASYHKLSIKIDKPKLTARTQQGYYAQP